MGGQPLWRDFADPGRQQLTAMSGDGAWASVAFDVARGGSDRGEDVLGR